LYGGLPEAGARLDWYEIAAHDFFEAPEGDRSPSLELCLNLAGRGWVRSTDQVMEFEPRTTGFYVIGAGELRVGRQRGEHHRFFTVSFSCEYLRGKLGSCDGALHPLVETFLRGESLTDELSDVVALTLEQEQFLAQALQPPVFQGARALWYESKLLQLMVDFCFARPVKDELFCDRQKRVARERVSRTIALLEQRLAEPPTLEEIGRAVGCSPFYLSRTFSSEMQMTIPQYLRKLRMERAAELLRDGKHNVTEAALEVGYSSLSHFSQAFCQTIGCCPALYPMGLNKSSKRPQSLSPELTATGSSNSKKEKICGG
jgi:AraC-like DNA-binding protein